jgi:putative phosphoesterase
VQELGLVVKIGILSDIHANCAALSVVVEELHSLQITDLIIAGDTVGYYYEILGVRELLHEFTLFETLGNHEISLLSNDQTHLDEYRQKYGSGLSKNLQDLGSAGIEYIRKLSHPNHVTIENVSFLISHGAPWDINQYLYPNSSVEVWNKFESYSEDIFILGHTHHQMLKRVKNKLIINPGSVGQSRCGKPNAEWAIFDLSDDSVTFKSTPYLPKSVLEQCAAFDPGLDLLTKHLAGEV